MRQEYTSPEKIQAFWNKRANLGLKAGTNDVIAKKLEMKQISNHISDGLTVLDLGCGNGMTAIELAKRYKIKILGVDYAKEMIKTAKELLKKEEENLKGSVTFCVGNVLELDDKFGTFDVICTERVLINLANWQEQQEGIKRIASILNPRGKYLMCENSQNSLDNINKVREGLGLEIIIYPWHNRYLRDEELREVTIPGLSLELEEEFTSSYYFLSRIVNAKLSADEGREPKYEDPINLLSLSLPVFGNFAQTKMWIWKKT